MENTGETVDDQGSGWFLVKKKHRSSSKFSSVQSWVGSFSGKSSSNNRSSQSCSNEKVGNLHGKHRSQPPKTGVVQKKSTSASPLPVSSKGKVVLYDDNRVLEQDTDCHQPALSHIGNSSDRVDIKMPPLLEVRHDVTQKIMWGDLEDEIVVPHHERNVGSEIRFGNVGNNSDAISPVLGHGSESTVNHNIEGTSAKDSDPCQLPTSMSNNPEEFGEVEGLSIKSMEEEIFGPCNDASICKNESCGHTKPINLKEDVTVENVAALSEMDDAQVTRDPDTSWSTEKTISADSGVSQNAMTREVIPKPKNINASAEEGSSESKERFRQRLWCFLFENLNRSVDELYLLCELECDVEQMKEAVLVLEEATLDFKELTSRVEKFENAKRSSSLLKDGMPITLKSDHRRPHALSWEVRRMTTSPHKAEILSSSIEAFRKIQEERASIRQVDDTNCLVSGCSKCHQILCHNSLPDGKSEADKIACTKDSSTRLRKRSVKQELVHTKQKVNQGQNGQISSPKLCSSDVPSATHSKDATIARRSIKERSVEKEKHVRKDKMLTECPAEKHSRPAEQLKRHQNTLSENEKEKRTTNLWKCLDAWREKRNWEDILSSPFRVSSRISHSPGLSRKSVERARVLHDKLMSPEKKKKTTVDLKRDAEEKHARAMRIRSELENEKMQKLQRTSEKLNRVSEWQAVRNMKLREGMYARHQRSESRHEAYLAQVARRAGDESSKVNEVRFITSLNEENKKLILRQKLHGSEMRRAEKLQFLKIKQKEDSAREEAVLERRKTIEAEKLQRLVETQRKKEEAQVRREEERRASSAAREARSMEHLRRKEVIAKAQQEEAELLAQKLVEKLSESEQRRKFYLEQIRERASMDFREQSSPLLRRPTNKETPGRSIPTNVSEEVVNGVISVGGSAPASGNGELQHSMKRRVKKIRQRLMALKHDFPEPLVGAENTTIGYRTAVGSARAKIGRWLQELQRLRQERKEGAAGIGLIAADMTKFLEGKEPELQASRQAGLLDFIASALPASHISKPEACQVTIHLLKLLRVVLSLPPNRSYFLSQNLLPPIIPMMSAALENYIKIVASLNITGINNVVSSKTSVENFESISEVLDGLLWTVTAIIGYGSSDKLQLQMREGLTELLIAYQVIHRLRDLFALYDRPQVEGSPFPSSIVFSIQLLVVLTSRPETNNVIDWDVLPVERKPMFENEAAKLSDSAHSGLFVVDNSSGDQKHKQGIAQTISLPGKSDDFALCESNSKNKSVDASVELKDNNVATRNGLDVACSSLGKGNSSQKDCRCSDDNIVEKKEGSTLTLKQPIMSLVSAISETGLVCLPSLLTSVLLQANNRLSAEQASYVLPLNFEEVGTGVLKLLNNLAYIDITFMQKLLARPDLKMEFFHLMGFLLSHCNTKWKSRNDQVGLLLLESLLLLSHFALFHPENQAVLRWGNSPTILHKVCDLPFVFFSDPELMPVLAGTLVAACYGSEQNRGVVQQELSVDMLLSLLKSCRNVLPHSSRSIPTTGNLHSSISSELNQTVSESKRSVKSVRGSVKNLRTSLLKGLSGGNSSRTGKDKVRKVCEAAAAGLTDNLGSSTVTSAVLLHHRFPGSFIDRAEKFFSDGVSGV